MPDQRQHRGPHPQDHRLFDPAQFPALLAATDDLSWLLGRGYAETSSLKIVGDRYSLVARQRVAVGRCACSRQNVAVRQQHRLDVADLAGQELWIDGYNVLTSIEAALSGGAILIARDGCCRDMASMHGSYRKVAETVPAIELLGDLFAQWDLRACRWLFDEPVSNSGRLKTMLRELAEARQWPWTVELVPNPDPVLVRSGGLVASADSQVIQHASQWFNLAREAIQRRVPAAWTVDLG